MVTTAVPADPSKPEIHFRPSHRAGTYSLLCGSVLGKMKAARCSRFITRRSCSTLSAIIIVIKNGDFVKFTSDYNVEEVDDKVAVSVYAQCTEKEAIVKATFVDNSVVYNFQKYNIMNQNQCSEEQADELLTSNGIYPYTISEFEVAANQTMADKMKDAGANTLIGMGIVFIALIFISFIISLLKYVPALLDKETREKKKAEKAKKLAEANASESDDNAKTDNAPAPAGIVDIVNTATGESVMNDSELVAVISAAVMAAQGGKTRVRVNYPSNDKLVVRPRKRNKR